MKRFKTFVHDNTLREEVQARFEAFLIEHQELSEAARRSLSRVMTHVRDNAVGIITAHRGAYNVPNSRDPEGRTNKQRNQSLRADMIDHGIKGHIHVRGRYIENFGSQAARPVDEHSFLISVHRSQAKQLHSFLTKHGEKYNQDSVLYKHPDATHAHLIGTSHDPNAFPAYGETHNVGEFHANRVPEFHSIMTRGGGKPGQTPAAHKSFAFIQPTEAATKPTHEDVDQWGGVWESFGFWNPITFSARRESIFV